MSLGATVRKSRSTSNEFPGALEELIDRGLDDMLDLEEVVWITSRHLGRKPRDKAVIGPSLETIGELLERGYAVVGNLDRGEDGLLYVRPWGLGSEVAVERIGENWDELYDPEHLDDRVWLELTEAGREQARRNQAG
jgi:hypothetical protein